MLLFCPPLHACVALSLLTIWLAWEMLSQTACIYYSKSFSGHCCPQVETYMCSCRGRCSQCWLLKKGWGSYLYLYGCYLCILMWLLIVTLKVLLVLLSKYHNMTVMQFDFFLVLLEYLNSKHIQINTRDINKTPFNLVLCKYFPTRPDWCCVCIWHITL